MWYGVRYNSNNNKGQSGMVGDGAYDGYGLSDGHTRRLAAYPSYSQALALCVSMTKSMSPRQLGCSYSVVPLPITER